ncbi:MAG TPA: hypothetical protein VF407_12430 [Polyangiaceae bacterium]
MTKARFLAIFPAVLSLAAMTGCASVSAAQQHTPIPLAREGDDPKLPQHVYRLDFAVTSNDPQATPNDQAQGGHYSLTLGEHKTGRITSGANVALVPSNARLDVGTKLLASYRMEGDKLLVDSEAELSSSEAGTIHKVVVEGEALVAENQPTLVAKADDPQGRTRYQLMVTATRLR